MKAYLPDSDTPIIQPKKVAVVGGGNVAMDAARCAKRLGAERSTLSTAAAMEELPARARGGGARRGGGHHLQDSLTTPWRSWRDENGDVQRNAAASEMELGEPDASGRRRPIEVPGSEFDAGRGLRHHGPGHQPQPPDPVHHPGPGNQQEGRHRGRTRTVSTSRENVYAGGDAVTGAATVILAMGAGKTAAKAIDEALSKK